jgi:hypothetical protein
MNNAADLNTLLAPLRRWISLMQNAFEAAYFIRRAEELGHPHLFVSLEAIMDFWAYFRSALNSYAKCFVSAGQGRMRINAMQAYAENSARMTAHDRLIALRHTYVAHNDENEMENPSFGVKEAGGRVLVRLNSDWSFPFDRLYELRDLIQGLQEFIVERQRGCIAGLSRRIGMPIVILEGESTDA